MRPICNERSLAKGLLRLHGSERCTGTVLSYELYSKGLAIDRRAA